MKKITKLVAVSAAAMTFGITGVSALNNTNVVNADNLTVDNGKLSNDISSAKNPSSPINQEYGTDFGMEVSAINTTASQLKNGESLKDVENDLKNNSYCSLGWGYGPSEGHLGDASTLKSDYQQNYSYITSTNDKNEALESKDLQNMYNDANQVLVDLYNQGSQPAASNANKQTANNDNKQSANNNNNANAQNNSSNKKADVVANANNSNAKNNNAQGAVANKQNTNNKANAQQNTVKSNANVEAPKTVANENESNSAKNQNNGAIAETQNENTTAAGETSTVVKAQAKSASNSAAQKNNTPVFPQTGEQTSEILAVAGGLIIAATAAGIVVYKKRN